jgi:hypothetical protein
LGFFDVTFADFADFAGFVGFTGFAGFADWARAAISSRFQYARATRTRTQQQQDSIEGIVDPDAFCRPIEAEYMFMNSRRKKN